MTTKEPASKEKFLLMALGVATQSKCKFQHGAVVVKHGHVLGAAPNIEKNNPRFVDHRFCQIHSEIAAMKRAGWPTKATVYVARINGLGKRRFSKPCANCQEVLDSYRCKIFFTEDQ